MASISGNIKDHIVDNLHVLPEVRQSLESLFSPQLITTFQQITNVPNTVAIDQIYEHLDRALVLGNVIFGFQQPIVLAIGLYRFCITGLKAHNIDDEFGKSCPTIERNPEAIDANQIMSWLWQFVANDTEAVEGDNLSWYNGVYADKELEEEASTNYRVKLFGFSDAYLHAEGSQAPYYGLCVAGVEELAGIFKELSERASPDVRQTVDDGANG
ncbi:hypothetical protein PG989_006645 [Apiospora arundinis]